jgi:hypothetical protein
MKRCEMKALESNPTAKSLTILACFFVAYAIRPATFLGLLILSILSLVLGISYLLCY